MPIVYVKWITREMVRSAPEARFVFGDNTQRRGYGGQAAAMRDEPNAIGVATKRAPDMREESFFSDDDPADAMTIANDLIRVERALAEGRTIYVPFDGLGTGLSELPTRAPRLYADLVVWFRDRSDCPWDHQEDAA